MVGLLVKASNRPMALVPFLQTPVTLDIVTGQIWDQRKCCKSLPGTHPASLPTLGLKRGLWVDVHTVIERALARHDYACRAREAI